MVISSLLLATLPCFSPEIHPQDPSLVGVAYTLDCSGECDCFSDSGEASAQFTDTKCVSEVSVTAECVKAGSCKPDGEGGCEPDAGCQFTVEYSSTAPAGATTYFQVGSISTPVFVGATPCTSSSASIRMSSDCGQSKVVTITVSKGSESVSATAVLVCTECPQR